MSDVLVKIEKIFMGYAGNVLRTKQIIWNDSSSIGWSGMAYIYNDDDQVSMMADIEVTDKSIAENLWDYTLVYDKDAEMAIFIKTNEFAPFAHYFGANLSKYANSRAFVNKTCDCGAKHTGFPDKHYDWCKLVK